MRSPSSPLLLLCCCALWVLVVRGLPTFVTGGSSFEPTRVGYQGEPGAYSEKALRALLGPHVVAIGFPTFEEVFKAVANHEVDYACLPVENSLGGSIHANHDLLLRYNLHIIGEHEFRVEHALMALPGTKKEDIKKVYSHPQALAQTENYILRLGAEPVPAHDTAGSARRIAEEQLEGAAAVASDLAAEAYGLEILDTNIEDDDSNFTRFMLLSREPVNHLVARGRTEGRGKVPYKTSIVFTLPNTAGALYKALACFSLRDIDFCKIESRPTSVQLLQYLKYRGQAPSLHPDEDNHVPSEGDLPRFRYCFYLDFVGNDADEKAKAALANLREQCPYVRVLGSYPAKSYLVGPIQEVVAGQNQPYFSSSDGPIERRRRLQRPRLLKDIIGVEAGASAAAPGTARPRATPKKTPLKIGVVGYGPRGRFFAHALDEMGCIASALQVESSPMVPGTPLTTTGGSVLQESLVDIGASFDRAQSLVNNGVLHDDGVKVYAKEAASNFVSQDLDVVFLCVPSLDLEAVLRNLPLHMLHDKLVVDAGRTQLHAREILLALLPPEAEIVCADPMFGPSTPRAAKGKWTDLALVYERVRVKDMGLFTRFVQLFEDRKCKCVEMTAEEHDEMTLGPSLLTQMVGRAVSFQEAAHTALVNTPSFEDLMRAVEQVKEQPHDELYALYRLCPNSKSLLRSIRATLVEMEAELAKRDGYLAARQEVSQASKWEHLSELKKLLKEVVKETNNGAEQTPSVAEQGVHEAKGLDDDRAQYSRGAVTGLPGKGAGSGSPL
mmetsp:Transcript_3616/g.14217  ORF Transcript_3616/g.14217 Transcript_3616/m.14217 type:complete len:781 (-) Transcript_3616:184-2526(-)